MEKQIITHQFREWDAQAYDEGNELQTSAFLHFLQTNNIKTENRTIFDIGCGTGKLSAQLAEKATHVHGSDASNNMIGFATNKYGHVKNLSFEHCFAEDFQSQNPRQLALASFCVHWFEDKKQAFQSINNCLEPDGEFFATVSTNKNQKSISLVSALELVPNLKEIVANSGKNITDLTGISYPSHEELDRMLCETGFKILKREEQFFNYSIKNRNELKQLHWPIISSRPIIQYIPTNLVQPVFENYIDLLVAKMPKDSDGQLLCKFSTTIVHARKIKK